MQVPANFGNATFVVMVHPAKGGKVEVKELRREFCPHNENGEPIFGKNVRRLLNVKEIALVKGVSMNEAQNLRKNFTAEYLVDPSTPVEIKEPKKAAKKNNAA